MDVSTQNRSALLPLFFSDQ